MRPKLVAQRARGRTRRRRAGSTISAPTRRTRAAAGRRARVMRMWLPRLRGDDPADERRPRPAGSCASSSDPGERVVERRGRRRRANTQASMRQQEQRRRPLRAAGRRARRSRRSRASACLRLRRRRAARPGARRASAQSAASASQVPLPHFASNFGGTLLEHRLAEALDVGLDHRHAGGLERVDERAFLRRQLGVLPGGAVRRSRPRGSSRSAASSACQSRLVGDDEARRDDVAR